MIVSTTALEQQPLMMLTRALPPLAEDSLSISLTNCTVTHRDGRVTQLDQVYIRGQSVRFYVVPDMLAQAPMFAQSSTFLLTNSRADPLPPRRFKRVGPNAMKGRGIGTARGRATIMRAQCKPDPRPMIRLDRDGHQRVALLTLLPSVARSPPRTWRRPWRIEAAHPSLSGRGRVCLRGGEAAEKRTGRLTQALCNKTFERPGAWTVQAGSGEGMQWRRRASVAAGLQAVLLH